MTEETHLAVVEVDKAEDADVTLRGGKDQVSELIEAMDVHSMLQNEFSEGFEFIESLDIEIVPRHGLAALQYEKENE